jgi:hypothetical protein
MNTWFTYLKEGLSRTQPDDRLAGERGYAGFRANLQNLRPFAARHWLKGALGALLILLSSLLSFPLPLINRYLIDEVILGGAIEFAVRCGGTAGSGKTARHAGRCLAVFLFHSF